MSRHPTTNESRACRILSAALIESAASLNRVRWALHDVLTEAAQDDLDRTTSALHQRGVEAENEACRLEYEATLPPTEPPSESAP